MASFTWRLVANAGSLGAGTGTLVSASILLDGTILGIDSQGNVYTRNNLASWLEVPSSDGLPGGVQITNVTVTQDGSILGVGSDGMLYFRETLYGPWHFVNKSQNVRLVDVIQLQNKSLLGVGTDHTLYTCTSPSKPFTQVANSGNVIGVAQIEDGTFIGVGTDHQIYTRTSINASWALVPNSGSVIAVTQLMNGTYLGVNTANMLCSSSGSGSPWTTVPFSSGLIAIAQLHDGTLIGVTTGNVLSIAEDLPCAWVPSPQVTTAPTTNLPFRSITQLQDGTFFGVSQDAFPRSAAQLGGPWSAVGNPTALIAASQLVYGPQNGTLLSGLLGNGLATCPAVGGFWTNVPSSGSMVNAIQAIDGTFMGIGTDQQLYITPALGQPWQAIPAHTSMLTVAQQADGTLVAVGADNNVYQGRFSHLLGQIDKVVLFMLENRGFDSLLGYLYSPQDPPSQVIPPPAGDQLQFNGLQFIDVSGLANSATIDGQTITRTPGYPVRATDSPGVDPYEPWENVNFQLFGSQNNPVNGATPTMTGFLADYTTRFSNPDSSTVPNVEQIMMMYTPADVPVISRLARSYAVSDEWFSSVPTQTNANRAFSMTGTSLGEVNNGMYSVGLLNDIFELDAFRTETIFNVLQRSGFTDWGIFWQAKYPTILNTQSYTWNSFPLIGEYVQGAESHFHTVQQFLSMAESGTLPAFSFIEPSWGGAAAGTIFNGNDYHPPADTVPGEIELLALVTAMRKNPAAWAKTLFIVTFDEHGGTYDHVPPPWGATPPWGDGEPSFPLQNGFGFDRFGVRIPTLLISPLIPAGTVFRSPSGVPYDHTSVIATVFDWQQIDKRTWNLGARVASAPTFDNVVTLKTARTDDPFAPAQPAIGTPMNYSDPFQLKNANGDVVIKAYSGVGYYFPQLGTSGAIPHSFRLGFGPLTSGSQVQIFTSEVLVNKIDMTYQGKPFVVGSVSTALGAWANEHDCYYYPTEDFQNFQQQVWNIQKVGAQPGDPILYGDQVYLANVYYSGQGLTANGSYLTTAEGTGDGWTLLPPSA